MNKNETIRIPSLKGNAMLQKQMASELQLISSIDLLTEDEEKFCQLFCSGGKELTGNQVEVYKEVFGCSNKKQANIESNKLLASPAITNRIKEIIKNQFDSDEQNMYRKMRVVETLFSIMDETRDAKYKDKWGVDLSPAPLRAVSVNAAKAISEICGFKSGDGAGVTLNGENNVTFNVIVPQRNA